MRVLDSRALLCQPVRMSTRASRFNLRADAPQGFKRFSARIKRSVPGKGGADVVLSRAMLSESPDPLE